MQLLLLVLNEIELLDPLLEAMMTGGVRGATILNSTGMARQLASTHEDYPFFGSLRMLLDPDREESKTIFMVVKEEEVPHVKEVLHSVLGDLSRPDTAVLFTLPVIDVEGIG